LFRPIVLARQLSEVDKRPNGGLRRLLETIGLFLALFFFFDDASLAPLLADSEKPLFRPVVLAQQLSEVDKRPNGGLRTTFEVVDANRALVGSKIVLPLNFFSLTHSRHQSRRCSSLRRLLDDDRARQAPPSYRLNRRFVPKSGPFGPSSVDGFTARTFTILERKPASRSKIAPTKSKGKGTFLDTTIQVHKFARARVNQPLLSKQWQWTL
jgi:hypothetical protein